MYLQTGLDRLNHFLKRTELFNKSKAYYQFERWFRLLEKHVFNFSSSTLLSDFCPLCTFDLHGLLINFRIIFHLHFESINQQSNYSDFWALDCYHSPTWLTSTCWSTIHVSRSLWFHRRCGVWQLNFDLLLIFYSSSFLIIRLLCTGVIPFTYLAYVNLLIYTKMRQNSLSSVRSRSSWLPY